MNEKFLIFFGIFGVIIVIAVVSVVVNNYFEKKRTAAFQELAGELNFEFFPTTGPGLAEEVAQFHLFGLGHGRQFKNHLRGEAGGIELNIFDYRYTTGSGKSQQTHNQSIFAARSEGMNLPLFSMRPGTIWHKIGNLLGLRDINFETHPGFSRLYLLKGPDEQAIRAVFQPEILEYFEKHPKLNIEGCGDVLIYSTYKRLEPAKIRDFMSEGFEILKLFQTTGDERPPPADTPEVQ
jgi:hypothetical protein